MFECSFVIESWVLYLHKKPWLVDRTSWDYGQARCGWRCCLCCWLWIAILALELGYFGSVRLELSTCAWIGEAGKFELSLIWLKMVEGCGRVFLRIDLMGGFGGSLALSGLDHALLVLLILVAWISTFITMCKVYF